MDNGDIGKGIGHYEIRIKNVAACNEPVCDCDIEKSDRGWFYRTHKFCTKSGNECGPGEDTFNLIITYAVLCGILWIAAGAFAFLGSSNMEKMWIMISAGLFLFGYILFVGLFGSAMQQINSRRYPWTHKGGNICKDIRKKIRRSSDEFMGYSICSFILIGVSIAFTGLALF